MGEAMRVVFICILCVLAGCKAQVTGLQRDASFTGESLRQAPVLVAGVLPQQEPLRVDAVMLQGEALRQALIGRHAGVELIATRTLLDKAGESVMRALWLGYLKNGTVDGQALAAVHQCFPESRYLLLARIETDRVHRYRDEREEDIEADPEHYRTVIARVVTRDIAVSLLVYDMRNRLRAWQGSITEGDEVANESSDTFERDAEFGEVILSGAVSAMMGALTHGAAGLAEPEEPAVPEAGAILRRVYRGFAEHLL